MNFHLFHGDAGLPRDPIGHDRRLYGRCNQQERRPGSDEAKVTTLTSSRPAFSVVPGTSPPDYSTSRRLRSPPCPRLIYVSWSKPPLVIDQKSRSAPVRRGLPVAALPVPL